MTAAVCVASRDARLADVVEALAAIAPERVHLEVATIAVASGAVDREIGEDGDNLRTAEKGATQFLLL